jgi:hypothetical protein
MLLHYYLMLVHDLTCAAAAVDVDVAAVADVAAAAVAADVLVNVLIY